MTRNEAPDRHRRMRRHSPQRTVLARAALAGVGGLVALLAMAQADTVAFVSGDVLQGSVIQFRDGRLAFQSERFGLMAIDLNAIVDVKSNKPIRIALKNGDQVNATALHRDEDQVEITTSFGVTKIRWQEMAGVNENVAEPSNNEAQKVKETELVTQRVEEPENEAAISVSVIGNQTATLFGGETRNTLIAVHTSYTHFFSDGFSVGAQIPASYQLSRSSGLMGNTTTSLAGLGDISISAGKVFDLGDGWPHIKTVVNASFPTGRTSAVTDTTIVGLSSGYWSLGGEAHFEYPVSFGSFLGAVGYSYYSPRGNNGPGFFREFDWNIGHGFQLNPNWALINSIVGSVITGSSGRQEPAYFNVALSYATESGYVLHPSFAKGLNFDAQDFLIGFGISKRW